MDLSSLSVDFAALRCLKQVHELRSFTAAAQRLEVNQSAVSYTIDKLRRVFGDPLFFRQGGGVVPTERCDDLVREIDGLLGAFGRMVTPADFAPNQANGTVRIGCNYYERQVLLPALMRLLRRQAPGLTIELVNATAQGEALLRSAEVDLLIGPLRPEGPGFYRRKLLDEGYACVMDAGNPLAQAPLQPASYVDASNVTVTYGGGWRSAYLAELEARGLRLREALKLPSPAGLDRIILGTDLVATIPRRIAQGFVPALHMTGYPFDAEIEIDLVWTERTHRAPLHRWLREQAAAAAGTV